MTQFEACGAQGQTIHPLTEKLLFSSDDIPSYGLTAGTLTMNTTSSRFFDELAKLMTSATGAAQGVRKEVDGLVQSQVERVLNNMNIVKREDFDVVRDMAEKARSENERLEKRIAELEAKLANPSS
jgi:BMFP domain-containing protein YqiC